MRIERWYWLGIFCLISLLLHIGVVAKSRHLYTVSLQKPVEIEIQLAPPDKPLAAPPQIKQEAQLPKKPVPQKTAGIKPAQTPKAVIKPVERVADKRAPDSPAPIRPLPAVVDRVVAPKPAEPGGLDKLKDETPMTIGLPSAPRNTGAPKIAMRIAMRDPNVGGGGSPAMGLAPGGRNGAPGPEAPSEDIVWNRGGAGGTNLPREAARMGGGGGRSILSVENPLAKEAIPDDTPGMGPGLGGGAGIGKGGGYGAARGNGIGTRLDGRVALGTLRAKPGPGIGAGAGAGIGTRAPGGGRGTGADLPGTGGAGIGYGRGSGIGVGAGSGVGIGNGKGGGNQMALTRGIPFGDITGMLGGNQNGGGGRGGGPGGRGAGTIWGTGGGIGGGGGRVHMVYLLDTSGSMRDGNKIGKAKEALKKALNELKSVDSFSIVHFDKEVHTFSESMLPATKENVATACDFVDKIELKDFTNMSGALEKGFTFQKVTHIFLLSDGEPHGGIEDTNELLKMVHDKKPAGVRVITLAIGLGEQFKGMALLKAMAEQNDGQYSYVNLSK